MHIILLMLIMAIMLIIIMEFILKELLNLSSFYLARLQFFWRGGNYTAIILIMLIIPIIANKHIMEIMHIMLTFYEFMYVSIWVLRITCGRTSVPPSPRRLMDWELSFVQPCGLVGLNTSRTRMRPGRWRGPSAHPLDRGRW